MKGHVYKRGNTWTYVVDIKKNPIDKKRVQKSKGGFLRKKDAELEMAKIIAAEEQATKKEAITLWNFSKQWYDHYKQTSGNKESTFKRVHDDLITINRYFQDKILLQEIDDFILEKYFIDLKDIYSRHTLSGQKTVLKMIFEYAKKLHYINDIPNFNFRLPKKTQTIDTTEDNIPKYLEKVELKTLLYYAEKNCVYQVFAMYHILAYTGMRIGELVALKWSDIDFKKRTISISKTLFHKPKYDEYSIQTTKSMTSRRTIEIDINTTEILLKLQKFQKEIILSSTKYHDEDFVFINLNLRHPGYPLVPRMALYHLKKDLKSCGIQKDFTLHGFRHTHTSLMAEAGIDLTSISKRLGHANDKITRIIYLHVTKTKQSSDINKFNDYMNHC